MNFYMANLLIVESPAKAKTIRKYLGNGYKVVASMGHVRDLPKSQMGVDIEHDFTPKYISIRGKGDLISSLKKDAKAAKKVYLATDPDREGEAISWHLAELLGLDADQKLRVTFNEITKSAVQSGIKHPRAIDRDLVDSQQARRILDRIVGYQISPFLWKKIRKGLSAGRVQSVATRLVVDREEEIERFVPVEYWTADAKLLTDRSPQAFVAKFYGVDGKKKGLATKEEADEMVAAVKAEPFVVNTVKKGVKTRNPAPPFITSTLQQEASRRFNYQAKRTMQVAQQLYEGVEVEGVGMVGLITYMRTDSLRISAEALTEVRELIGTKFGENFRPESPRVFKAKSNAQDAHEAIRPSMVSLEPSAIKKSLTADQFKLYRLIWERFMASQMASALYDTVSADISAGRYTFRATGHTLKFAGYTALYEESRDEKEEEEGMLPELLEGDKLALQGLDAQQHFTQPPPRFTEATLIKALEENGIGRPSTYAPTISTILQREYVEKEGRVFKPTTLGVVTNQLMRDHFGDIVNVEFTANMEQLLDEIENGKSDWTQILRDFYTGFSANLKKAEEELGDVHIKLPDEESDEVCELCGRRMVIKIGRFGKFLACPGYPECKNTKPITVELPGVLCPKCGGRVLVRKSRNNNKYFGCEFNPKCDFMTWDEPLTDKCPRCGGMLFKKGRWQKKIYCQTEGCGYETAVAKKKDAEEKDDE